MKAPCRLGALALLLPALAANAQEASSGRQLYEQHCASCHGSRAGGDGWLSRYLTRTPPPLNALSRSFGGKFPAEIVRSVIDGRRQVAMHGPRDMPVWGQVFTMQYKDRSAQAPERVSPEPPHFASPPGGAESYAEQNI